MASSPPKEQAYGAPSISACKLKTTGDIALSLNIKPPEESSVTTVWKSVLPASVSFKVFFFSSR